MKNLEKENEELKKEIEKMKKKRKEEIEIYENKIIEYEKEIEELKNKLEMNLNNNNNYKILHFIENPENEKKKMNSKIQDLEKSMTRLKQVFTEKIKEFRMVVYLLFGYKLDVVSDGIYKASHMYSEQEEDHLLFQLKDQEIQILETEFYSNLDSQIMDHLTKFNSFPSFTSAVTNYLFNRQTKLK